MPSVLSELGMSGWEGSSSSGSGLPFWSNDCEAPANPANLSHTVLAPPEDVTFHPGEQINISWHSGIRADVLKIDGPPWAGGFHPASWQWSAFLQSEDEKTSVTILGMWLVLFRHIVIGLECQ